MALVFNSVLYQHITHTMVGTGSWTLTAGPVDADQVWYVTSGRVFGVSYSLAKVQLGLTHGADTLYFQQGHTRESGDGVDLVGEFYVEETEEVIADIAWALGGDTVVLELNGLVYDIV